jgi:hypothetical protein
MCRVLAMITACALVIGSSPARANNIVFYTGNDLLTKCSASKSDITYYQSSAFCTAYVGGVFDSIGMMQGTKSIVCVPSQATLGQLRDDVYQYLLLNPAKRHRPAAELIVEVAIRDFPCG